MTATLQSATQGTPEYDALLARLARRAVLHEFDADHEAASADVAHQLVLARPVRHAFQHVGADFLRIL